MPRNFIIIASVALGLTMLAAQPAMAQYPRVPVDVQAKADAAMAAADAQSDAAFQRALPTIKADAARGKPYLPAASQPGDLPQAKIPAFPGAWGGGMYSFGGRGGKVYEVTSLDDSGPGTLREACAAAGPRIIVFNVAGIIHLKSRIRVRAPYITIAGQTAPGDGVCVAGATFAIDTHDVVIRFMRFRRGSTAVGNRDDSLGGNPIGNIMIDHVSASWGLDENLSMYRHMYGGEYHSLGSGTRSTYTGGRKLPTVNITIQNCISSEALNTYGHAFGSTIGGLNSTFHHNLWACNTGRNPSVGMNGDFTFVNNVLFNWRHRSVDGGDDLSRFNIINNYYKPGPATLGNAVAHRILKPESSRNKTKHNAFGKAYVAGNVVVGDESVTKDNWDGGVQLGDEYDAASILPRIRVDRPFPHAPLPIESATAAYEDVLAHAGATLPKRDPVDARVIEMVRSGKMTAKAGPDAAEKMSHVGFKPDHIAELVGLIDKGMITDISQVGGYPQYEGKPYVDSDRDGMPDNWETAHGLNPNDAEDAAGDLSGDGYTNIEKYLDGIDPAKKVNWTDLKNNIDPLVRAPGSQAGNSGS
jgi:hypothetical protein